MKKITRDSVDAFMNARPFRKDNTGNEIAYRYNDPERTLSVTNAGWFSNTTKERLNGIPNVRIHQKNFNWYLNDKEWDGKLIDVI